MHGNKGFNWFVLALGFVLFLGCMTPAAELDDTNFIEPISEPVGDAYLSGTPHDPIAIDGDINFSITASNEGWPGDGSLGNPYVINSLDIDLGGAAGHCININNTKANFTISYCKLTGANVNSGSGIYLNNAANGKIIGNIFLDDYYAIYLYNCNNSIITDNTCDTNTWGIQIYYGESNIVHNNTCLNHWRGIHVYHSTLNVISNNTCNYNDAAGITISASTYNTVVNNTCNFQVHHSIDVLGSSWNIVCNNTCNSTDEYVIYLDNSDHNTVSNNSCGYNFIAIYLLQSDSNIIANNTLYENLLGIFLFDSDNNDILWNILDNNGIQIEQFLKEGNLFDYNYYSDYHGYDEDENGVGDTPYSFNGGEDVHPLMALPGAPPFWLETPVDQVILIETPLRYDLNASVYGGIDTWWVNDTETVAIDQSGVVTNNTFLPAGNYDFHVYANDSRNNILSGNFSVMVQDTFVPVWLNPPSDQQIEFGVSLDYDLNATDISGLDVWWVNDTLHFSIGDDGCITTLGVVPVGVYGIQICVNDTWGNILSGAFSVTVVDTLAPTWVEQPQNQTVVSGTSFVCDFDATDPSGISEWWIDDTVHFTIDWTGVIRTVGNLQPGVYGLRVYVSDIYDHTLWAAIFVEVTPTSTTTIPTTPTSTTTSSIPNGVDPVMTLALGAGIGGVAVAVIVIVFLKRKS